MNATAAGFMRALEGKVDRAVRRFLTGMVRWRMVARRPPEVPAFYLQRAPVAGAAVAEATLDQESELKAPHRVQVCDLTKSEAEELLDCLEHERGPYLFVECTMGARGFTVSYLTRQWRPQPPARTLQGLKRVPGRCPRRPGLVPRLQVPSESSSLLTSVEIEGLA